MLNLHTRHSLLHRFLDDVKAFPGKPGATEICAACGLRIAHGMRKLGVLSVQGEILVYHSDCREAFPRHEAASYNEPRAAA